MEIIILQKITTKNCFKQFERHDKGLIICYCEYLLEEIPSNLAYRYNFTGKSAVLPFVIKKINCNDL